MDGERMKKVLASLSIAALLAGTTVAINGCTTTEKKAGQSG